MMQVTRAVFQAQASLNTWTALIQSKELYVSFKIKFSVERLKISAKE